jgi:ribosomal protein L40E
MSLFEDKSMKNAMELLKKHVVRSGICQECGANMYYKEPHKRDCGYGKLLKLCRGYEK